MGNENEDEDDDDYDTDDNYCCEEDQYQDDKFRMFPWIYKLADGLIAGSLGVAAAHPIDIVKTRFENQAIRPVRGLVFKSLLECVRWTLRRDGYFGLYRRASFNILSVTPEKAIKLAANDYFSYRMEDPEKEEDLKLGHQVCAAGMAGACQCVTTPLEVFRCRIQAAEGMLFGFGFTASRAVMALRPNSMSIIRYMYQQGLVSLTATTLLRDIMFTVVFCPLFRTVNGGRSKRHNTFSKTFLCGFVSGGCSAAIVTPFEVVRRHIAHCRWKGINQYKTIPDSIRFVYANHGFRGFYLGSFRRLMVAAPLFGVTEATYHLGISERFGDIVINSDSPSD